ncbi:MAG: aminoacyl-tRNA deacylase [Candidatus Hodarchaeota archaeon]
MVDYPRGVKNTIALLEGADVDFDILPHITMNGTKSTDASQALEVNIDQILKVLIGKTRKKTFFCAILLGNQQFRKDKLKKILNTRVDRLAQKKEIEELIGFSPGSVPPVGLPEIPCIIDSEVMKKDFIIGSAGSPYYGLKLTPQILVDMNHNVTIADIAEKTPTSEVNTSIESHNK